MPDGISAYRETYQILNAETRAYKTEKRLSDGVLEKAQGYRGQSERLRAQLHQPSLLWATACQNDMIPTIVHLKNK